MNYHPREKLNNIAAVRADVRPPATVREERLARWALLLDQDPDRYLATLSETEFQPEFTRDCMRHDGSPLAIAFEDPVFRAEGLEDDSYGEAKRFFALSDRQLHRVVCSCRSGATVRSGKAAEYVREIAKPDPGLFAMLWDAFRIFR
ncbi:hypothetical protein [Sinorhizobium fredii]|uniref:hypothetical protein n=1 Tax=Rhizobium fredii TaxID=380 RepID=UPI00055E2D12|nr:hypothetical protein [Sinorhizobium fredii]